MDFRVTWNDESERIQTAAARTLSLPSDRFRRLVFFLQCSCGNGQTLSSSGSWGEQESVCGPLQRPGKVAEVYRTPQPRVGFQERHDDRHGRLVVTGTAGARLVDDVYTQVGVITHYRLV